MMIRDKVDKYSIDEWEKELAEIYGNVDSQRTPTEIWLLLMEDVSRAAEAIRREKYTEAVTALTHTFCWTCSFVWRCRIENDLHINIQKHLSKILWNKYPGRCSFCGQERCICSVRRWELEELSEEQKEKRLKQIEDSLIVARARTENIPKNLDNFVTMLNTIYKGTHYSLPIQAIAFHFMEEVGETSTCIRVLSERMPVLPKNEANKLKNNLEREIADIICWTISLLTKLDYKLGAGAVYLQRLESAECTKKKGSPQTVNLQLSRAVWEAFQRPDGHTLYCPKCEQRPCKCKPLLL